MARSTVEGPNGIVRDSLVLYLDANNSNSYPGTGNRWYDLTKNANHFTLFNSPTHNGKRLSFNGTNQYAQCVNNTLGNFGTKGFTIDYTVNVVAAAAYSSILMKRDQSSNIGQGGHPGICDRVSASEFYVQDDNGTTPTGNRDNIISLTYSFIGSFLNMTYVIEKNGAVTTGKRYINGVLQQSQTKTFIGTNSVDNTYAMTFMLSSGGYVTGDLYYMRMYNKALSASEVLQNYISSKSKVGL
jgi:hypothetical protein